MQNSDKHDSPEYRTGLHAYARPTDKVIWTNKEGAQKMNVTIWWKENVEERSNQKKEKYREVQMKDNNLIGIENTAN